MKYNKDIQELRFKARRMAAEAGLKITSVGDGLFRLEGQDYLLCASQIVRILEVQV